MNKFLKSLNLKSYNLQLKQSGQALIELALVLPVLTLMFMGIYLIGRLNLVQQRCEMAVRHGAWLKAHTNLSHDEIKERTGMFFTAFEKGTEEMLVELDTKNSSFIPVDLPVLGDMLNKMNGSYKVTMTYGTKTPRYFAGIIPYSVPIKAECSMARGSWANIGQTIMGFFKTE